MFSLDPQVDGCRMLLAGGILAAALGRPALVPPAWLHTRVAPDTVPPGSARLRPARVRLAGDTIVVLSTPPDGAQRVVARLWRHIDRVGRGAGAVFRETQRYEYDGGDVELDTLEMSARSLALRHIAERSTHTQNVLDVARGRMRGVVTPTDTSMASVDIAAPPAFHDMALEAFIGTLPLDPGGSVAVPIIRPPSTDVRIVVLDVATAPDTLPTAQGPVVCLVVHRRGRDVTTWIARTDGHIVRMRWSSPDGSVTWKLPARDSAFVAGQEGY